MAFFGGATPALTMGTTSRPMATTSVIVVAGEVKKGKSTALNNIFGVDFPVSDAPSIMTEEIAVREVRKDHNSYLIVDTPGFGERSNNDEIKRKVADAIRGLDFTLLYCVSVNPGSVLTKKDESFMVDLQNCLHDRIWEKCVLLLTYSDDAVSHFNKKYPDDSARKSKAYIKDHAHAFEAKLKQVSSRKIEVHTVFDYKDDYMRKTVKFPGIVAVPVKSRFDATSGEAGHFYRSPDIIPGIPSTKSWQDLALGEINNKIAPLKGGLTKQNFKYFDNTIPITAGGASVGAGLGAAIGILGGPLGVAIGGGIGGAAGAIAGLFVGVSSSDSDSYTKWMKEDRKKVISNLRRKAPHKT